MVPCVTPILSFIHTKMNQLNLFWTDQTCLHTIMWDYEKTGKSFCMWVLGSLTFIAQEMISVVCDSVTASVSLLPCKVWHNTLIHRNLQIRITVRVYTTLIHRNLFIITQSENLYPCSLVRWGTTLLPIETDLPAEQLWCLSFVWEILG